MFEQYIYLYFRMSLKVNDTQRYKHYIVHNIQTNHQTYIKAFQRADNMQRGRFIQYGPSR